MMALAFLQDAAAAVATANPVTIQAIAAIVLPAVVSLLKLMIPALEGKALLYANLGMNALLALGLAIGAGAPPVETITLGIGAGLAGSKVVDTWKHGTVISPRHRK